MPAKRCPMCRRINPDTAQRCDCGYEFGQEIVAVIDKLKHQQTAGWGALIAGIALLIVTIGLVVGMIVAVGSVPVILVVGVGFSACAMTGAGARTVLTSRRSKRELAARMQLPAARIVGR